MQSQNERTLQMKQAYVRLHESGLSPKNIAHMFDLDVGTVYKYLQEIADANGVTRKSLLETPRAKHVTHERQFAPIKPVDTAEFRTRTQRILDEFSSLRNILSQQVKTWENLANQIEEEEASWQTLTS